jgi:hypothetical protein
MKVIRFSMGLGGIIVLLAVLYFFPWRNITWGRVVMSPERTVTVSGYAESDVTNQIAQFSAGVNAVNDSKDVAVKTVNDKINAVTEAVKNFGVAAADIQTQSINVYQEQVSYVDNGVQKTKPGQWNAGNTISITLRDLTKANGLADLLTSSGATNVYGPNFQLDNSNKAEDALVAAAVANAQVKAEEMAKASGATLDKVISVTEGSSGNVVYPVAMMAKTDSSALGGGAALETGTTKISKTVTVIWSLK